MRFEMLTHNGKKWVHDSFHDDPRMAIASLCMRTGKVLMGSYEEGYETIRITDGEGKTVAAVREHRGNLEIPVNAPGTPPKGDKLGPLRRWHGLTWVGWVNFLFLRWFLFRIGYIVEEDDTISRYYVSFWPRWRW